MAKLPWYLKCKTVYNEDKSVYEWQFTIHWLWRLWIKVKLLWELSDLDIANSKHRPEK